MSCRFILWTTELKLNDPVQEATPQGKFPGSKQMNSLQKWDQHTVRIKKSYRFVLLIKCMSKSSYNHP